MMHALRAATVGVAAAALVLSAAASASAHNYVVSSTPTEGETLTVLPERFEVVTNEFLYAEDLSGFGIYARDADGLYYGDGCVTVDGNGMSAPAALGEPGDYTLVYQFISADGHSVGGELSFSWQPDGEAQPATGSATPALCGDEGEETPDSAPSAEPEAETGSDFPLGDALWIGGAALAVAAAVGLALAATRRRP